MKVERAPEFSNPFALAKVVSGYEAWYKTAGRRADRMEKALLKQLITRFPQARNILEIGSGTGHFSREFAELHFQTVGLDMSLAMLSEAVRLGGAPYLRGDALDLPFASQTFDLAALVTTLEFVHDPAQALAEASRVARHGLIVGALNRQSLLGRRLKNDGGPVWKAARFFTPEELIQLVQHSVTRKQVEIVWRTTLWPVWPRELPLPWGGFIGLAVHLIED